ncbi:MAG: phosphatase PAP2 family protein [Ardenticatenales bacterium]|nr:phosphatase PAP2 family protein [Ardenticatenales bacterium]
MDLTGFLEVLWFTLQVYRTLVIELLLLLGVSLSFLWARGEEVDRFAFTYLNSHLPYHPRLDRAMHLVGQLGTLWMGVLWMGALFLLGYRTVALIGVGGMVLLWGVVRTIKTITRRERPYVALDDTRLIGYPPTGLSFPSGHAAQSFFTAYYLAHELGLEWGRWLLFALAGLICYSRIYVGAHYPRDVVAGVLLGLAYGYLLVRIVPEFPFALWFS